MADLPIQKSVVGMEATGIGQTAKQMQGMGTIANEQAEAIHGLRTSYLFLSFGLLAAGGLMKRMAMRAKELNDTMLAAAGGVEHQATKIATTIGEMGQTFTDVREEMVRLGVATQWTARQAGDAMETMAKAGFSAAEAVGSAEAVLKLATIGTVETTEAATLAVGVFRAFAFEVRDAEEAAAAMSIIVAQLGHAAVNATTDVSQLGEALKFVGAVAEDAGLSMEQTIAMLMIGADAMVRGGTAGRALRMAILNISKAVARQNTGVLTATDIIEKYNLNLAEQNGSLKEWADIIDELNIKLAHLSDTERQAALQAIFTTRGATLAAAAMEKGGQAIRDEEIRLKAASAIEAIHNKTKADGTDTLIKWGKELDKGESALDFLTVKMGFTRQEAILINEVLQESNTNWERYEELVRGAADVTEVAEERLKTLEGTMQLMNSSIDAMWTSIGTELLPVYKQWAKFMKFIADILEQLPKPLKMLVGVILIMVIVIGSIVGQIMNWMGSTMMLVAALVMLNNQTGQNYTMMQLFDLGLKKINATIWGVNVGVASLAATFGMLAFQIGMTYASLTLTMKATEEYGPIVGMLTFSLFTAVQMYTMMNRQKLLNIWLTTKERVATLLFTNVEKGSIGVISAKIAARKVEWILMKNRIATKMIDISTTVKSTTAEWANNTAQWARNTALYAGVAALGAMIVAKSGYIVSTIGATIATWGLNTALYANPLVWILGIIVAVVAIIIILWKNIDKVTNVLKGAWQGIVGIGNAFKSVVKPIQWIINLLQWLLDVIDSVQEKFAGFGKFMDKLLGHSIIPDAVERGVGEIRGSLDELSEGPQSLMRPSTKSNSFFNSMNVNVFMHGGGNQIDMQEQMDRTIDEAMTRFNVKLKKQLEV